MSAYIVADETINRVISFLEADMRSEYTYSKRLILDAAEIDQSDEHWDIKLGYSMAHMNDIAQDARYGAGTALSDREGEAYEWHRPICPNPYQAVKSLQCYLYQCSEGDVPERPLYKALRDLEYRILNHIVSNLPAYDKAEWA